MAAFAAAEELAEAGRFLTSALLTVRDRVVEGKEAETGKTAGRRLEEVLGRLAGVGGPEDQAALQAALLRKKQGGSS